MEMAKPVKELLELFFPKISNKSGGWREIVLIKKTAPAKYSLHMHGSFAALREAMECGLRWLVESNIRIKEPLSPLNGSFCGLYDTVAKAYPFVYCEITGYAIQFLLRAYRGQGEPNLLEIAREGGEFLLKAQYNRSDKALVGAFPYGYRLPNGERIEKYFSFDTAICLGALVELYEAFGDKRYLESGMKAGVWLEGMQKKDGSFRSAHFGAEGSPVNLGWYGDGGCLHAKNVIGLLKLYLATQDERFLYVAKKTLEWILTLQHDDGYFRATRDYAFVFTHAHGYALEGLLYGYLVIGEKRYLDAAVQGGRWLLRVQNSDGSLYQYYGRDINAYLDSVGTRLRTLRKFVRPRETGVTAQALRIWLALYYKSQYEPFLAASNKAAKFILTMQSQCKADQDFLGAFYSSCDHFGVFSRRASQFYAWTTMFTWHALKILKQNPKAGSFEAIVRELF